MMKNALPSITLGTLTTIVADISGAGLLEAVVFAFVGGVVGYLAKLSIEFLIKKLKKLCKKNHLS